MDRPGGGGVHQRGRQGKALQSKAVIARTNLGLLLAAIDYVTGEIKRIYFEGILILYLRR